MYIQTSDASLHSTGSTMTTSLVGAECKSSSHDCTIQKRVRFDERYNQIFVNHGRYAEDCHETWYDEDDYDDMRAYNRFVMAHFQRQEPNERPQEEDAKNMLPNQATILRSLFYVVTSIRYEVGDVTSILSPALSNQLTALYTGSSNAAMELIGLELHVDKRLKQEAQARREAIQEVVYDVQKEYDRGLWTDEELQRELRDCCLNHSQAFGLFAQLQALAQLGAIDF